MPNIPAVTNCRTTLNCSVVFLCVVLPLPTNPTASGGLGWLCSLLLALQTWITALTPALPRETHCCRADGAPEPSLPAPRSRKVNQPTPRRNGVCKGTGQGWLRKGGWARRQNAASSFLYKKWWYSIRKMCQCCWSVHLKTLYFQSTLQMQHGSKVLSIITHIPKVYLLCGGRDAQEQVLKSLNDPKLASTMWCDTGTRCKYTCCWPAKALLQSQLSSWARFCQAKASQLLCQHLPHSPPRSCTKRWSTSYLWAHQFSCISYLGSTQGSTAGRRAETHEDKQSLL